MGCIFAWRAISISLRGMAGTLLIGLQMARTGQRAMMSERSRSCQFCGKLAHPNLGVGGRPCPRQHFTPDGFMGRIFEVRKHTMFARWNRMAKQFAKIGKDITIAVKSGGSDPNSNPALRRVIQNARAVNMPKDKVDAAIKRASGRDATNYAEVVYEG